MCKSILVMDSDPAIRMLYEDKLMYEGYDVITCDHSSKLMELIGKIHPDVVLMDIGPDNGKDLNLLADVKKSYGYLSVVLSPFPMHKFKKCDLKRIGKEFYVMERIGLNKLKQTIPAIIRQSLFSLQDARQYQLRERSYRPMVQRSFNWLNENQVSFWRSFNHGEELPYSQREIKTILIKKLWR